MSGQPRDWLPVEAAAGGPVRERLAAAVAAWAGRWFASAGPVLQKIESRRARAPEAAEPGGWRRQGGAVAISCAGRAAARLTALALDARPGDFEPNSADRQLMQLLELRLLEDLAASLETALAPAATAPIPAAEPHDPFAGEGGVVLTVADSAGAPLALAAIPHAALIAACKASLGTPSRRPAKLTTFRRALAPAILRLDAELGQVELPLDAILGLSVGDVVILDSRLDQPASVTLSFGASRLAQAALSEIDGRMALTLQGHPALNHER